MLYVATLRDGHDWGGDFSQYIHHAQNLVSGVPYDDTGYIYDPLIGPMTYPPVFPLLLAPAYSFFGLDFFWLKVVVSISFVASLGFIFRLFSHHLPQWRALLVIGLVALNPFILEFKDGILSDLPFLLFLYATLLLIDHRDSVSSRSIPLGIAIGVSMALAYGTRTVGVTLPLALVIYDFIKHRRISLDTFVSVTVFALLALVMHRYFDLSLRYGPYFSANPLHWLTNAVEYGRAFSAFLDNGYSFALRLLTLLYVVLLGAVGYFHAVRTRLSILEVFPIVYIGPILPFYVEQLPAIPRYLLPLLPLIFFFCIKGSDAVAVTFGKKAGPTTLATLLVLLGVTYIGGYSRIDNDAFIDGVTSSDGEQMFSFFKRDTPPDSTVLFAKPRVLSLLGERKSAGYVSRQSEDALELYKDELGEQYYVVVPAPRIAEKIEIGDPSLIQRYVGARPENFSLRFENGSFKVYQRNAEVKKD